MTNQLMISCFILAISLFLVSNLGAWIWKAFYEFVMLLQEKEKALSEKKKVLAEFESEFQQAYDAFKKVTTRVEEETAEVEKLLKDRSA